MTQTEAAGADRAGRRLPRPTVFYVHYAVLTLQTLLFLALLALFLMASVSGLVGGRYEWWKFLIVVLPLMLLALLQGSLLTGRPTAGVGMAVFDSVCAFVCIVNVLSRTPTSPSLAIGWTLMLAIGLLAGFGMVSNLWLRDFWRRERGLHVPEPTVEEAYLPEPGPGDAGGDA